MSPSKVGTPEMDKQNWTEGVFKITKKWAFKPEIDSSKSWKDLIFFSLQIIHETQWGKGPSLPFCLRILPPIVVKSALRCALKPKAQQGAVYASCTHRGPMTSIRSRLSAKTGQFWRGARCSALCASFNRSSLSLFFNHIHSILTSSWDVLCGTGTYTIKFHQT